MKTIKFLYSYDPEKEVQREMVIPKVGGFMLRFVGLDSNEEYKYAKAEKMPEGEKTDDAGISLLVEKGWDVDNAFQVRKEVEHFMTELDEIPLNAIVGQEDNFSSDYGYSLKIIEPDTPSTEPDTSSIEPDTSSI